MGPWERCEYGVQGKGKVARDGSPRPTLLRGVAAVNTGCICRALALNRRGPGTVDTGTAAALRSPAPRCCLSSHLQVLVTRLGGTGGGRTERAHQSMA